MDTYVGNIGFHHKLYVQYMVCNTGVGTSHAVKTLNYYHSTNSHTDNFTLQQTCRLLMAAVKHRVREFIWSSKYMRRESITYFVYDVCVAMYWRI